MNFLRTGFVLCLFGIYTTWMLSYSYVFHVQLPCGESNGCTAVAMSSAARIFGVPLPIFGLSFYVVLAGMTARCLWSGKAFASRWPFRVAVAGAMVSTAYTIYSVVVLRAECVWCIASNFTACVLAVVFAFDRKDYASGNSAPFLTSFLVLTAGAMAFSSNSAYRDARHFPWDPEALAKLTKVEMVPDDSVIMNRETLRPSIVLFMDLECPACQEVFQQAYRVSERIGYRLVLRQLPQKIHVDSFRVAVLCEEAMQQGQGDKFVKGVIDENIANGPSAMRLFRKLCASETRETQLLGRRRVQRDQALARRLGLSLTPSIFLVPGDGPIRPSSLGEIQSLVSKK